MLNTGATLNGRALAQTAVTLDANAVTMVSSIIPMTPVPVITPVVLPVPVLIATPTVVTPTTPITTYGGGYSTTLLTPVIHVTSSGKSDLDKLNDLLKILKSLQAQQASGQGTSVSSAFGQKVLDISSNLAKGDKSNDVVLLQRFLISQNKGPAAESLAKVGASAYFGELTRLALAEFQSKVGIVPAFGNFGRITRSYLKANY